MLPKKEEQAIMVQRQNLINLIEPNYLSAKGNKNREFIVKKIMGIQTLSTIVNGIDMSLMIIESGFYGLIAGMHGYSVGESIDIEKSKIIEWVNSYISSGISAWKLTSDGANKSIEPIAGGKISKHGDVYSEVQILKEGDKKYAFIRSFYPGYNECKLYSLSSDSLESGKEIPLDTLENTKDIQETEQTGLSEPAIVVSYDTDRVFERIKTFVDSIDRISTQLELEFYKHLDAYTIFRSLDIPETAVDERTGTVVKEKLGRMFMTTDPEADIIFRTNDNPMIDRAREYIQDKVRSISAISHIPIEYLGLDTNDGAIGSESRSQKNAIYFSKIEGMRGIIETASKTLTGKAITFGQIVGYETTQNSTNN